jgi:hypothetical protein
MIETDNAANDRSVNSLINFETVKFFGMERRECCLLEDFIVKYNKVFFSFLIFIIFGMERREGSIMQNCIVAFNKLFYLLMYFCLLLFGIEVQCCLLQDFIVACNKEFYFIFRHVSSGSFFNLPGLGILCTEDAHIMTKEPY